VPNDLSKAESEAWRAKRKRVERLLKEEKEKILISVKRALEISRGRAVVIWNEGKSWHSEQFSTSFSCSDCQISLPEIEPKLFSFNSPFGACKTCQGLGKLLKVNPDLVLNPNLSLNEGAILPWFSLGRWSLRSLGVPYQKWSLEQLADQLHFSLNVPFRTLPPDIQKIVLYGDKTNHYEGVVSRMERVYHETSSEYLRAEIYKFMTEITCPECRGARLSADALSVKINQKNIYETASMPVRDQIVFLTSLMITLLIKKRKLLRNWCAKLPNG